jgi:hypothetical protein
MKKLKIFLVLSLGGLLLPNNSIAQTECTSYHRKNCLNKEGIQMRYDSQSKSAIMAKGQVSEFHLVAYNGLDYRISLCSEEIIGDQIQFRIYEKVKTLIKPHNNKEEVIEEEYAEEEYSEEEYNEDSYSEDNYSEDSYSEDSYSSSSSELEKDLDNKPKFKIIKELLYDNADDSYAKMLEFTAEGSKSLIIEITVPGDSGGKSKLKIRQMGCVGVLIEHAKSRHSGF